MELVSNFRQRLKPGGVYRREYFDRYTKSTARALEALQSEGVLKQLNFGLYYCPVRNAFGEVFPKEHLLIKEFLRSDKFLVVDPSLYNSLGLGLTQVYNFQFVYNKKRDGEFNFLGRNYRFMKHRNFPKEVTREFLLVDLLNNSATLALDEGELEKSLLDKVSSFDQKKLLRAVKKFGLTKTQRFLYGALNVLA